MYRKSGSFGCWNIFIDAQGYKMKYFLLQIITRLKYLWYEILSIRTPIVSYQRCRDLFPPQGWSSRSSWIFELPASITGFSACQQGGQEGAKRERQQHKTCGTLEYNRAFRVAPPYFVVCIRAKLSSTSYTGLDSLLVRYMTACCVVVKIFS